MNIASVFDNIMDTLKGFQVEDIELYSRQLDAIEEDYYCDKQEMGVLNKQIAELKDELRIQIFNRDNLRIANSELKDKLSRRNMQIKDLKAMIEGLKKELKQYPSSSLNVKQ